MDNHDPKPKIYLFHQKPYTNLFGPSFFQWPFSTRPPIPGRPPPLVHQQFPPVWVREDIDLDEAPEKTPMGPLVGLPNVDSKGFGGSKRALTTEYAWWELWPSSSLFVDGSREVFNVLHDSRSDITLPQGHLVPHPCWLECWVFALDTLRI